MLDTAVAIVFRENGKELLLVKRDDIPIWVLPGGGIDAGETPENAACRELFEETGFQGRILRKVAFYKSKNALSKNVHVFELVITGGEIAASAESPEVNFFGLDRLPKPFFLLHQDWLADARTNSPVVIEKGLSASYWRGLWYGLQNPKLMWHFFLSKLR